LIETVAMLMRGGSVRDAPSRRRLVVVYTMFIRKHNEMIAVRPDGVLRLFSTGRGFHSFDDSQIGYYFKHRKADLIRESKLLEFEESFVLNARSRMSGREVFLWGCFELRNGVDQYTIADLVFGGHQSKQSLAFSYFINFMFER
jgi:hypothetical protein